MDSAKTRTSGGENVSGGRVAPLKPKDGLSGPPATFPSAEALGYYRLPLRGMNPAVWRGAGAPLFNGGADLLETPCRASGAAGGKGSFDCGADSLRESAPSLRM